MQTLKTTKIVSAAFISLVLSACGGGSSSPLDPPRASSSGNLSSGAVDTTSPNAIGVGFDNNFTEGVIGVSAANGELSAGASTVLTVNVVSSTNTLVTTPVTITFNSPCIASGEAKLSLNGTDLTTNSVSADFGAASVTYKANGCAGTDNLTASAAIGGSTKVARAAINVLPDTVKSIEFNNASPTSIYLKGSGGTETSQVRFRVMGNTDAPISNVEVEFSLSTTVGGIALTTAKARTDKQGYVSTTVQAGTIPTSVQVLAREPISGINTPSNELVVATGLPDQNSMSLSATLLNPSGWNHDGETSTINIRLADSFNNPPPDNTTVYFTTEGGSIGPSCRTEDGACSVTWRSQNVRPHNGRVTILATTIGNESFVDKDGDGLYTKGKDVFNTHNTGGNCDPNVPVSTASAESNADEPCDDLGEPYLDKNENGIHDDDEEISDFNENGKYDTENGMYNGILCKTPGDGCTKDPVYIREQLVLAMSSDYPVTENGRLIGQPPSITLGLDESVSFDVLLADIHGNAMPFGTTVSIISASASNVTITQNMPTSGVANGTGPTAFTVTLKGSKTELPSGNFSIAVKTPYLETAYSTLIIPRSANTTVPKYIGSGSDSTFVAGDIELGVSTGNLAPGGTTSLAVSIVDDKFALVPASTAQVTFSSPCITSGKSTLTSASGTATNTVTAVGGRATITYTANDCIGADEITARSNLAGLNVNVATKVLTIAQATAQSIQFVDAEPQQISLAGTGGQETSTLRFIVRGSNGQPVPGAVVRLELNNLVGGLCIANSTDCKSIEVTSNKDGYVSVIVQAGSIATSVRVTATTNNVSTQSSRLVVSTGIPDQDSMSLSADMFNPEGWSQDGSEVNLTIRMADAFNNPPPKGTTVSFTTSGGKVESSCTTEDDLGTCQVKWISQDPRPSNGRVRILATTLGNESFIDANGDGVYQKSVDIFASPADLNDAKCAPNVPVPSAETLANACDDLGEAYLDRLDRGIIGQYNTDDGFFVDIDGNFAWTRRNGVYNGALCKQGSDDELLGNCVRTSVTVRDDMYIVMSGSVPKLSGGRLIGQPANITLAAGAADGFTVTLEDENGNSMPAETTITINSSGASNVTISHTMPAAGVNRFKRDATNFRVNLTGGASTPQGSFSITVTTPGGTSTSYTTTIN